MPYRTLVGILGANPSRNAQILAPFDHQGMILSLSMHECEQNYEGMLAIPSQR
jgi:hypothetical protein